MDFTCLYVENHGNKINTYFSIQIFTFSASDDSILDIDINSTDCSDASRSVNDVFFNLNNKSISQRIRSPKIVIRSCNLSSPMQDPEENSSSPTNCYCRSKEESDIVSFINKYGSTDLSELVMDKKISNHLRDSFLSQWQKLETHPKPNGKSKTISCVERFSAVSPKGKVLHQSTCVQITRSLLIRSKSEIEKHTEKSVEHVPQPMKSNEKIEIPMLCRIDVSKYLTYNDKYNASSDHTCKYLSITSGQVDSLIAHACSIGINSKEDYHLFHKVFIVTHVLFISDQELIEKLIFRFQYFTKASNLLLEDLPDFVSSVDILQEELLMAIINVMIGMINYWCRPPTDNVEKTLKSFCEFLKNTGSIKKELLIKSALGDLQNRIEMKIKRSSVTTKIINSCDSNNSLNVSQQSNKSLFNFESNELAEQITLLECQQFDQVELEDLLSFKSACKNDILMNCVHFFNNLTFWIKTMIFNDKEKSSNDREKKVAKCLEILKALKNHQNFSAYTSVLYSLLDFPDKFLSKRLNQKLAEESQFISLSNKRRYHEAIQLAQPPFIPLLADTFSHLTKLNEIMPTFIDPTTGSAFIDSQVPTVNFKKMWQYFIVLQYFVIRLHLPPEKKYYQLKPNYDVLRFINNFKDALTETELYECRDSLLKSKGKKQSPHQGSEKEF